MRLKFSYKRSNVCLANDAWLLLGKEIKELHLKPIGYPRVLGIVAPYTGKEIEAGRYCSRFVVPIE